MRTTSTNPLFPSTELAGGYIVAIEVGPRSEILDRKHRLDKQMSRAKTDPPPQDAHPSELKEPAEDAAVTVGAQMGDKRASNVVTPHFMALKRMLNRFCAKEYSREVREFAFVLRVDGEIWHWNLEGCDRMRRSKKDRYITIDVYVPRRRWDGVEDTEIRKYLAECFSEGLQRMISKLEQDKVAVDGDALLEDFAAAKTHYLHEVETKSDDEHKPHCQ